MKKLQNIVISLILLSFTIAAYFYERMPSRMASHWNTQGFVDGYMPKFWGLFLIPIILFVIYLIMVCIPKLDPLKENVKKFRNYYHDFILIISLFLFYIFILSLIYNLGVKINMSQFIIPAFGILFYYTGILIENSKRNWFIGIRTPWTLMSDRVWDKTAKLGGKLLKISAIIALIGFFFLEYAIFIAIIPMILSFVYAFAYSYFEYKKEDSNKKNF